MRARAFAGKGTEMPLKPDDYRHHFSGLDLTEAQTIAMCEAVCAIAEAFADLAFDMPTDLPANAANDNDSPSNYNVVNLFRKSTTTSKEEQGGQPPAASTPAKQSA